MMYQTGTVKLAYFGWLSLILAVTGCASTKLKLESTPTKAQIYVSPLGSGTPRLVGETPLLLSGPELNKVHNGSGPLTVEFKKDGYTTAKTIITDTGAMDLTISLNLDPVGAANEEDQGRLNNLVDSIFESQRLARAGRQVDALAKLKIIQKDAPQVAAAYELEGGIYYLQKKYREALDAYSLAVKYNPKNFDAIKMRNFLEQSMGLKPNHGVDVSSTQPQGGGASK